MVTEQNSPGRHKAGLFDLRWIIALLFGIYGVVLTVTGIGFTTQADLDKAAGIQVNLWGGVSMLVVAALFAGWAWWRPIVVPDAVATGAGDDVEPAAGGVGVGSG